MWWNTQTYIPITRARANLLEHRLVSSATGKAVEVYMSEPKRDYGQKTRYITSLPVMRKVNVLCMVAVKKKDIQMNTHIFLAAICHLVVISTHCIL